MKTKRSNFRGTQTIATIIMLLIGTFQAVAHCDSYDGPVILDAAKALRTNDVRLVFKWISEEQEEEITKLFNKTYKLKNIDEEVYEIVERHFFETLVRLHRETEGASFTGLKPAGETKRIIVLSDQALETENVDELVDKFSTHLERVIQTKYSEVARLDKMKNESVEKGREYVRAYVDYTHTLEAIHDLMEKDSGTSAHSH